MSLGDTMSILKYKKANVISPKYLRNRRKTSQKRIVLDDFIGKFQAKERINCVDLKHEFKNRGV